MPWFIYNYPGDVLNQASYTLTSGIPSCAGDSLCAIYAQGTSTSPIRPVIMDSIISAIRDANEGKVTPGVTVLRPSPRARSNP